MQSRQLTAEIGKAFANSSYAQREIQLLTEFLGRDRLAEEAICWDCSICSKQVRPFKLNQECDRTITYGIYEHSRSTHCLYDYSVGEIKAWHHRGHLIDNPT